MQANMQALQLLIANPLKWVLRLCLDLKSETHMTCCLTVCQAPQAVMVQLVGGCNFLIIQSNSYLIINNYCCNYV